MGAGFGLNIAGTAVRAAGIDGQFGTELYGAWGSYMNAKLASSMQKFDADQQRYWAKDHLRSAEALMATAGKVQREGEEEAVNRYFQLGQDVGRIYAGAAGGNVDVSSGVVGNVESAARLMAQRDVDAIGRSAADSSNAYVAQAGSERLNYVRELTQARLTEIGATLSRKLAKGTARSQMVSAAGRWQAGHAENAADFAQGLMGQG